MFTIGYRSSYQPAGPLDIDETRHTAIFGSSGSGKSTLLTNLAIHYVRAGGPLFLIDPHGTFAEGVLNYIPVDRLRDVILFDPLSPKPVGVNPLRPKDELSADHFMKILAGQFGESSFLGRSYMVARNFLYAAVDVLPDPNPFDLWLMFFFDAYAQYIFARCSKRTIKLWGEDYFKHPEKQRDETAAAPMNKVDALVALQSLRHIFGQADGLDFFECMQTKKIVVFNLRKGQIGEDAANLLGSVIIRMVLTAGMQRDPAKKNDLCRIIVDEAHNFTKDGGGAESILAETRKYGLAFVVASQGIAQLEGTEQAIFSNVSNLVSFRVSGRDAGALAEEIRVDEPGTLVGLKDGDMYAKVKRPGIVLTGQHVEAPFWFKSEDRKRKFPQFLPRKTGHETTRERCIAYSQDHYGQERPTIERMQGERLAAAMSLAA
jgi:energy-coupling factor transporter ATP-binding protein EcfA2